MMTAWLQCAPARFASAALPLLVLLVRPGAAGAQPPQGGAGPGLTAPASKRSHTLFRPTPRELMRDLATDRPDQTESPYTVDAGHFQVEMDFVHATFDRDPAAGSVTRLVAWSVAPLNVKLGLLNRVDLQFVIDSYGGVRLDGGAAAGAGTALGCGNVATRVKVNLWGDDGGRTALAVMAFVRWPLPPSGLRNGRTEGGVIFPFAVSVADGWNVGAMAEVDILASSSGGYEARLINSITVGRSLTGRLGMYAEGLAAGGVRRGARWMGQLDVGWTYALRDTVQLDCGANLGLAGPAPTVRPFAGLSVRF